MKKPIIYATSILGPLLMACHEDKDVHARLQSRPHIRLGA